MAPLVRRHNAITLISGSLLLLCGFLLALAGAAPAAQAESYRYWSYWHADSGAWTVASTGPSDFTPKGGAVEGWRFTQSGGGAQETQEAAKPRPEPSFGRICADTPAKEGTKRVAVVLDPGTKAEAPKGSYPPVPRSECARVPADANGTEVLAAVSSERLDSSGLVCSIDGYPGGACGPGGGVASDASGSGAADPDGTRDVAGAGDAGGNGGFPLGAVLGVAAGGLLVGGLGGAAVLRARKAS